MRYGEEKLCTKLLKNDVASLPNGPNKISPKAQKKVSGLWFQITNNPQLKKAKKYLAKSRTAGL